VTDETIALEVQALRVGDLGIVSLACEPFTATGLAGKAASPFARTFVAGYTNGNIGYVPTADAFPLGGYEVTTAHEYYRLLHPVAPEAEALLSRSAQAALNSVKA
jgi:neutral ceramidase